MKVTMMGTKDVKPYGGNPRKNDEAVDSVARSIKEFGFRQPIVVDEDGVILVGHTRFQAAKSLGMDRVPVHRAEGLSPEQARAYRLADNKTRDLSDWDYDLLGLELSELSGAGFDLDLTGFDADEATRLVGDWMPEDEPSPIGLDVDNDGNKLVCPECGHEFYPKKYHKKSVVMNKKENVDNVKA